jgi:hypothetical protein
MPFSVKYEEVATEQAKEMNRVSPTDFYRKHQERLEYFAEIDPSEKRYIA